MTDYLDRETDLERPEVVAALDEVSYWSAICGRLMFRNLELRPGLVVLDLGCGTGFPLIELAHVCGSTCRLWGVDVWWRALARAAEKLAVHALPNVALARADGVRLPFAAESVDLVVSNVGVNNFEDPTAALAECARVTRPGGRIALTTNTAGHYRELYEVYREVLAATGHGGRLDALGAQESHRVTEDQLVAWLETAGWEVGRRDREEHVFRFLDGSAMLCHSLTRFGFLDGWRGVVPREHERAVFTRLESALNEHARSAGELRMTVPWLYVDARRSG